MFDNRISHNCASLAIPHLLLQNQTLTTTATMSPNASMNEVDIESTTGKVATSSYEETLAAAGKVHMKEPELFGKGLFREVKTTVGTWWCKVCIHDTDPNISHVCD